MRCYLISDNIDTLIGMRLAGVAGIVVHEKTEILSALQNAMHLSDVAVVFLTEKLANLCESEIIHIKETVRSPLLVIVPDRHGSSNLTASISRYLEETVGIHI